MSELYVEGIVDRSVYDAQREAIMGELASLPADSDPTDDAGRILADYLTNIGNAWTEATGDERNQIARQLFAEVLVVNKTAVAVVPRPEFRPFLELADAGAETRIDLSTVMSLRRKRRGSDAHMRVDAPQEGPEDGWVAVDVLVGCATRPRSRQRALTPEQVDRARDLAALGHSLRQITTMIGAGSHESVRRALVEPITVLAAD